MSKLFDQLKNAARSREERSPGLLLEALQKAQQPPAPADESAAPAQEPLAPGQGSDAPASAARKPYPYAGIALAIAIFIVVLMAWHASPWRAPQRLKIDPTDLKLDRNLDLQRPSSKGTTSPSNPS